MAAIAVGALLVCVIPTATASALTPNEKFVTQVYKDFLVRLPTPTELSAAAAALGSGTSRTTYVTNLLKGDEFLNRYVQGVYYLYQARTPTATELDAAIDAVQLSGNHLATEADVLAESEYFLFAGGNNSDYVSKLFADILMREGTPSEIAPHVQNLDLSLQTRRQVAVSVLRSQESGIIRVRGIVSGVVSTCPTTTLVDLTVASVGVYCIALDRVATAPEGDSWVSWYSSGGQLTGLWVHFASTTEYWTLAQSMP